jgi:transcriptional regulator with XRE-family HTH domain
MDLRVRVGLNVQKLRRELKLSQEELSARSEIHQSYLSDIERGRRNPSLLVLGRLAVALNSDIEQLVKKWPVGGSGSELSS